MILVERAVERWLVRDRDFQSAMLMAWAKLAGQGIDARCRRPGSLPRPFPK